MHAAWLERCSEGNLQRLLRLQKRAARIILDGGQFCPLVLLLKRLSWIPVYEEANLSKRALAYERINNDVPEILTSSLILASDRHLGQLGVQILILFFLVLEENWKVERFLQ